MDRSCRGVWGKASQSNGLAGGRVLTGGDKEGRRPEGEKTPAGGENRFQEGQTSRPGRVRGHRPGQRAQVRGHRPGQRAQAALWREWSGRGGLGASGTRVLHVATGAGVPEGGVVTGGSPWEERLLNG